MIAVVLLCLGMCLGAVVTIFAMEHFKALLLKKRISELETEMLNSHAEILRLEREITLASLTNSLGATG